MKILSSLTAMQQQAQRWKRRDTRVALVPTMGYLHAGHLGLIERARGLAGRRGMVVVSLYVNPTQFAPTEDLSRYPRDLTRDRRLCREAGVDVLFVPSDAAMYPGRNQGGYSTYVVEETRSRGMEGRTRPTHFRGVTTVVAKLFHLVLPDWAVFGAKDFQQAAVLRQMTADLNFPVTLVVAPTRREPDGLAMSSRNQYLNVQQRRQAVVLWHTIEWVRHALRLRRGPLAAPALKDKLRGMIDRQPGMRLDYVEFFEPDTLTPVTRVRRGTHMALAVFVGKTRLIDNGGL